MQHRFGAIAACAALLALLGMSGQAGAAPGAGAPAVSPPANAPIFMLAEGKSRSISPENLTGAKGAAARTEVQDGSAKYAAEKLGKGWKVNPYIRVAPGASFTLGEATGSGVIKHIWMTLGGGVDYRSAILRMYWDGEATPSVETPVGDFFASGWGHGNEPIINSQMVAVNSGSGFNSFWPMPYRRGFRMTVENRSKATLTIYYTINYAEQRVPKDAAYFHAQFRMVDHLKTGEDYTLLDGVRGKGQYVGTSLSHGAFSPSWWGEGEMKFFIDGDKDYPSIAGTGEEDYFLGSYGFIRRQADGKLREANFSSAYSGFYAVKPLEPGAEEQLAGSERRYGEYRWHIPDPIRFDKDLRVTIQNIGWDGVSKATPYGNGRYKALHDSFASVAYWYQQEPHAAFPHLPDEETLKLKPLQTAP
jgi:hypothetical protein